MPVATKRQDGAAEGRITLAWKEQLLLQDDQVEMLSDLADEYARALGDADRIDGLQAIDEAVRETIKTRLAYRAECVINFGHDRP